MKKIFEDQEIMIQSNKEIAESNGCILTFMDGSSVNVGTPTVTNKGSGEIIN